jgi:hypothetical protein
MRNCKTIALRLLLILNATALKKLRLNLKSDPVPPKFLSRGKTMNLDQIEKDMEDALNLPVDDRCKKLFSPLSDDEQIAAMGKLRRICGQLKLYCQIFKSKTFEHPQGKPIKKTPSTGKLVKVRPCGKEFKGKTYLGILVGDAALSSSVSMKEDSVVCSWSHFNPAILVPDLGEIIYGCESWWGELGDEDLSDITDQDIENVWYVKMLKASLSKTGEAAQKTSQGEA